MPKVSIITINYNGIKDTIECLESLKKILYPNYEVFVVDNASNNREGEKLKNKFGKYINLIQSNKNLGFAGGNNLAFDYIFENSDSKYVLLINNDMIVNPSFLNYLVESIERNSNICSVSPQGLNYYNRDIVDGIGISYYKCGLSFAINKGLPKDSRIKDAFFSSGSGCVIYSIKSLVELKKYHQEYFDSDFFMYSEDVDLGFRFIHLGYTHEYNLKSIIYHKGSRSSGIDSDFSRYYSIRNNILTIYKNYPLYLLLKYLLFIIITQFAMCILYIKRGKIKLFFRSYTEAIKIVPTMYKKRKLILKNSKIKNKDFIKSFETKIFPFKYFSYFNKK